VRPTKSAVPAYLSRLAGSTPAGIPQLRPPRTLFPSIAGALTDAEAPVATRPVPSGRGVGQPSRVVSATSRTVHETAAPGGCARPHPPDAPPLPPVAAAVVAPGPTPATPATTSPALLPVATRTAQPTGLARPSGGASPAAMPSRSAEPAASPASTKSRLPGAPPALPPKPVARAPEMSDYPGFRRPVPASAASAQVSIGTIEVTVVAPTPGPIAPPPSHQRARPQRADAARRATADTARQAARGAARRWFGAGQS
jgi:hypothetical protein